MFLSGDLDRPYAESASDARANDQQCKMPWQKQPVLTRDPDDRANGPSEQQDRIPACLNDYPDPCQRDACEARERVRRMGPVKLDASSDSKVIGATVVARLELAS